MVMMSAAARMHQVLYVVRVGSPGCRFGDPREEDVFKLGISDDWGRRRAQHAARFREEKTGTGAGAAVPGGVQEVLVLEVASSTHAERAALAALASDPDVAATFRADLGREFFQAACSRRVMRCVTAACEPFLRAELPLPPRANNDAVRRQPAPDDRSNHRRQHRHAPRLPTMRSEDDLAADFLTACPSVGERLAVRVVAVPQRPGSRGGGGGVAHEYFVRRGGEEEEAWRAVPQCVAACEMTRAMKECAALQLSVAESRVRLADTRACAGVLRCLAARLVVAGAGSDYDLPPPFAANTSSAAGGGGGGGGAEDHSSGTTAFVAWLLREAAASRSGVAPPSDGGWLLCLLPVAERGSVHMVRGELLVTCSVLHAAYLAWSSSRRATEGAACAGPPPPPLLVSLRSLGVALTSAAARSAGSSGGGGGAGGPSSPPPLRRHSVRLPGCSTARMVYALRLAPPPPPPPTSS